MDNPIGYFVDLAQIEIEDLREEGAVFDLDVCIHDLHPVLACSQQSHARLTLGHKHTCIDCKPKCSSGKGE